MGYTTQFKGELKFTSEPSVRQIVALKSILEEDCREHPEWGAEHGLSYIDLELTEAMDGLKWNGAEKTYDMEKLVNVVITQMRKQWPEFGLTGQMLAQGEEVGDVWACSIGGNGFAHHTEVALAGQVVTCPHCEEKFILGK